MNSKKSLLKLFWIFFKIGAFTIGGGLAMVGVIKNEICDHYKLIPEEEIVDVFAISQSLPGVIAINSSIYIGYKISGFLGAVVCFLGSVIPSYLIIIIIAYFFNSFADILWVQKAFFGVRAGLIAILAITVFDIGRKSIQNIWGIGIFVLALAAIEIFNFDIALIILGSGIIGFLIGYIGEKRNKAKGGI